MTERNGGLLVVTAHPDDESLIAGGVLAACAAAGAPTAVLCLTRGEVGPIADRRLAARATLGSVRVEELRRACAELGVNWVRCYRRADSSLSSTHSTSLVGQIARAIALLQPAAVVTFGQDGLYGHPDHIAAGRVVGRAIRQLSRPPHLYQAVWPETIVPGLVAAAARRRLPVDLWGIDPSDFGSRDGRGTITVDVRPFVRRKLTALRLHRTQVGADHLFHSLPDDLAEEFLGWERFRRVQPRRAPGDRLLELVNGKVANA